MEHELIGITTWRYSEKYEAQRAQYYGVELTCGHKPADPTGPVWAESGMPSTTGYGITQTWEKFCNACCTEHDLAKMQETGRGFGYLIRNDSPTGPRYRVTTWPGIELSSQVRIMKLWRNNFHATCIAFRCLIGAEVWAGRGPGAGQYCRIRRTKLKALLYRQ